MSLEHGRAKLLEHDITQEFLDGMRRSDDAYFYVREALAKALLVPHRKDSWFRRRRLKKALARDWHAPARHLESCPPCRAWVCDILTQLALLIEKPPSE